MSAHKEKLSVRTTPARILLVDDHPLVRQGLAYLLGREPDLQVCGEAEDHQAALQAIAHCHPDLVTVDLSLKHSHGFDLIKDIHERFPRVRILVVTIHDGALHAEWALRAGAAGYVTKEEAALKVVEAVRAVLRGECAINPKLALQIGAGMVGECVQRGRFTHDGLSDRELQVLQLVGEGLDRHHIAEQLHLDVNTVETYRSRLKEKLRLRDAQELLQYAIRFNRAALHRPD